MDRDAVRRLDAGRHAQRRPINAVKTQYVLADQVVHDRPPSLEKLLVRTVADRGRVVDERVVPHVKDVPMVPGDAHPPVEGGARHRNVLQPPLYKAERFVAFAFGRDGGWVIGVPLEQPVGEGREAEEVVFLLEELDGPVVHRARPSIRSSSV